MSGQRPRRQSPSPKGSRLPWMLAATLVLGVGVGAAVAQDRGRDTAQEGEISGRRRARLTGPEQREEGRRMVRRGEQISRRVTGLLDDARRERDILRITCLNDRLTQVNVNLRTAHVRIRALEDAIEGNDESRRNHEFTIIIVLDQKWRQLEREAQECIGTGMFDTEGRTSVRVWVVGVPDDDPTQINDVGIIFDVPMPPPSSGMM
ncbi:MAG: hypothetical protein IT379_14475 [Deltaproteobacteria bacterium]|nr:hypothetical protein [Deltaproteobacteria bacterium]